MSPPGGTRPTSNTARPADRGTNSQGLDPALVRRAVDALVLLSASSGTPMRRKQARAVVLGYVTNSRCGLDGWEKWLYNWLGLLDPTGETAVRNVMQASGSRGR